jgi:3-oxoacyl-[acyl-carrier-protein] synthase-3
VHLFSCTNDAPTSQHYALRSVRTRIGEVLDLAAWAEWAQIPHRGEPGRIVDGALMAQLLGIRSKSWAPEVFRRPETVAALGEAALEAAGWTPDDVDALLLVTCTPYELSLDQDAHRFGRLLGLRDDVPVLLLHAGCAGLARAIAHLGRMTSERVLLLTWNAPSAYMVMPDGRPNPLYRDNTTHPTAELLWFSPALFSDGAAAATLERRPEAQGVRFYTRDARDFDGQGPFHDPLVVYPGGGALHPPGSPQSLPMSAFGMHGPAIQRYYTEGMLANGRALESLAPDHVDRVARIYTHQASPRLIHGFLARSGLPLEKVPRNCERLGNLVSVSTLRLLDEDLAAGRVRPGDTMCFSVVGAGPERGAFTLPYDPPG